VTLSPSPSLAQSVYGSYPPSQIFNETASGTFDPNTIAAIVDTRMVNVASQTAIGTDLNLHYTIGGGSNIGLVFLNGTYLNLTQQNTPQAPSQTLSGLAFYPAKFRGRGGATWKWNSWSLTGTVNYLAGENNDQVTPVERVGSWTTIDATLRYAPVLPGILSGLHVGVAVLNAFDRDPPFVQPYQITPGLNYDSINTSPIGRFVSLQISKEW
jgi:hypothetical protein